MSLFRYGSFKSGIHFLMSQDMTLFSFYYFIFHFFYWFATIEVFHVCSIIYCKQNHRFLGWNEGQLGTIIPRLCLKFKINFSHCIALSVFMLRNKNVPYEERERFLEQLVLLEDYMQQGIPVVSRFLALYIASWNGVDHQQHIYRLLERITLASFAGIVLYISEQVSSHILNSLTELELSFQNSMIASSHTCKLSSFLETSKKNSSLSKHYHHLYSTL